MIYQVFQRTFIKKNATLVNLYCKKNLKTATHVYLRQQWYEKEGKIYLLCISLSQFFFSSSFTWTKKSKIQLA